METEKLQLKVMLPSSSVLTNNILKERNKPDLVQYSADDIGINLLFICLCLVKLVNYSQPAIWLTDSLGV